ncbi:MAG: PstS family phosphate ABC transporter substrate-binding protein [Steroidobacteraceae bacterium]
MNPMRHRLLTVFALIPGVLPGATPAMAAVPQLQGTVRCAGGSTMVPLVRAWGQAFEHRHPQVRIRTDPHITLAAGGFQRLLAGHADLADFVREPFPSEIRAFERRFGYAPTLLNVADGSYDTRGGTHAIAIYVNAANPLRGLTLAQLKAIFTGRRTQGALNTWGQLGARGRWADRPIHLYGMMPRRASGNPPGIVNYLEHRVLHGAAFRADLRVQVDRPGESALQAIVRGVASDPDGIGYSGFGYALPGVRPLPLAASAAHRWRRGTRENVASRRYPLSRRIYFLLNVAPGKPVPARIGAFLDYVLSGAGQRQVAHCAEGFLPLTAVQLRRARRKLAHLMRRPVRAPYLTRSGAISIVGYNDMRQMLIALDRLFERAHPDVHFALRLNGTRTAPAALAADRSLFAPMGAPFLPQALAHYRRLVGDAPIAIPIAHDSLDPRALSGPLAVLVPAGNPLRRLTMSQVRRLFSAPQDSLRWGQFGLHGQWASRPVHIYGLAPGTALARCLRHRVLAGRKFAAGMHAYRESAEVVNAIDADPDAIGFAALNRAPDSLHALALAANAHAAAIAPTRANLISGRYPLDRELMIYVRIPPDGTLDPLARQYLLTALSDAGQATIAAGDLGYLALSERQRIAERATVRALP